MLVCEYSDFIAIYPEFSDMSEAAFDNYYLESKILISKYCPPDSIYCFYIFKCIAHLATLAKNGSVGRVSSGTQGNTNVSLAYNDSQSGAFWNQTPFGAFIYESLIKPAMLGGRYII